MRRDDPYDEYDDDELDDDEDGASTNPFERRGGGSGLPGSRGGTRPSASGGGLGGGARPRGGSDSGRGTSPFGRSRSPDDGDDDGERSANPFAKRPGSPGRDRDTGSRPASPFGRSGGASEGGGGRSGGSGFPRRDSPGKKDDDTKSRSPFGKSGGSSLPGRNKGADDDASGGGRFGGGRFGGRDKKDDSAGDTGGGRFGGRDEKDDSAKDTGGGRFGGGRFGGRDKKDDSAKDTGGGRFGGRDKKDDSAKDTGGGRFGGGRFGGRDKKDDSAKDSGGGRFGLRGKSGDSGDKAEKSGGRFGLRGKSGGEKEEKGGGGRLGGRLAGGLRRGKKDDEKEPAAATGARTGFGGAAPTPGSRTAPGSRGAAAADTADESSGGGLRSRLPFGKGSAETSEKPRRSRGSRAPKLSREGLSLDTKLDMLGVGLVFGALALFLSILSGNKGALTEALGNFLSQTFGWGQLAIPVAMFAVGLWLIARHFGDEAPIVDSTRLAGLFIGYLGVLVLFQFIDSFSYSDVFDLASLRLRLQIAAEVNGSGGGWIGGQLYYLLVANVSEIGGFFVLIGWLVVSVMLIASLSAAELAIIVVSLWRSLQDSLHRRAQRRAAERSAAQLATTAGVTVAKPEQLPLQAPAAAAGLQSGAAAALPAPEPERSIPITMGGRTVTASFGEENAPAVVGVEAEVAETATGRGVFGGRLRPSLPRPKIGLRRGNGDKANTPETEKPVVAAAEEKQSDKPASKASGFRSRFSRGGAAEPLEEQSKIETTTPPRPETAAPALPVAQADSVMAAPGGAAAPSPQPPTPAHEKSPRLGDLLKPSVDNAPEPDAKPAAARLPFGRKSSDADEIDDQSQDKVNADKSRLSPTSGALRSAINPFGKGTETEQPEKPEVSAAAADPMTVAAKSSSPIREQHEQEDEDLSKLPPAQPKRTSPFPRSEDTAGVRASPLRPASKPGTSELGFAQRQERLNAIRSAQKDGDKLDDEQPERASAPAAPIVARSTPLNRAEAQSPVERPAPFARPQGESEAEESAEQPKVVESISVQPKPQMPVTPQQPAAPPQPSTAPADPIAPRPESVTTSSRFTRPDTPATPPATGAGKPRSWALPDYRTLLLSGSDQDIDRAFLLQRARTIEETLQSFGAPGRVVEVNTGPVITQFGVEPDYLVARSGKKNRVKVSAIAQLDKDLQLALGAKSIRIEAPVPGKGYVGIEVPNAESALVSLRDVMESDEFQNIGSPLTIALGQSVDGTPIAADLTAMPHLLVAGTTGSGKSVCVNSIICSLLTRNTPDKVKFIMIDPKRVELTSYNGIPHLVAPVVVELERIVGVLKWVTREMDERYKRFSNAGARNIEDFNKHLPDGGEIMPYIIVIIDELADLMMLAPDETERVITRIAALARATGIHLVIATQRPSVDVVTGLIKANFPARIAFAVAGSVDSRVILDQPGAERLLGRGDMLYMSGDTPAPGRLQGVFVSDPEIDNITGYWKSLITEGDQINAPRPILLDNQAKTLSQTAPSTTPVLQQAFWDSSSSPSSSPDNGSSAAEDQEDELYEEAVELIRRLNKASVSLLQRRLRIGYTRAARLIDTMEERGIVGPAESGSKPREVLPRD